MPMENGEMPEAPDEPPVKPKPEDWIDSEQDFDASIGAS